jgi:hypothetical protein
MDRALSEKTGKSEMPMPTESEVASYLFDLLGSAQRIAKASGLRELASKLASAREEAGRHF